MRPDTATALDPPRLLPGSLSELLSSRSRLYALDPIGVGTSWIESLTSYLMRLANAHCVAATHLLRYLSPETEAGIRSGQAHSLYNLFTLRSRQLNGRSDLAAFWSQRATDYTSRAGLAGLTMLPWRNLISTRGLLHRSQCWCPRCYAEWAAANMTVYAPLLWSLKIVEVCPKHRVWLRSECPYCHRTVPSLSHRGQPGCCPRCAGWLGSDQGVQCRADANRVAQPTEPIVSDGQVLAQAEFTAALLAMSAAGVPGASSAFSPARISGILQQCLTVTRCRWADLCRALGWSTAEMSRWLNDAQLLSVGKLFKLVQGLRLSPQDLLARDPHGLHGSNDQTVAARFAWVADEVNKVNGRGKCSNALTPAARQPVGRRASQEDLQRIKAALEESLHSEQTPSLLSICHQSGLTSPKIPWRHFPQLCRAVVQRRRGRYDPATARKRLEAEAALRAPEQPATLLQMAQELKTSPWRLNKDFPDLCRIIKSRRRVIPDVEATRKALETILVANEYPPPSLCAVGRRLGVNHTSLRQYFPTQTGAIIDRYAEHRRSCGEAGRQRLCDEVRAAVLTLHAAGKIPNRNRVMLMLRHPHQIQHPLTRHAFEQTMAELAELAELDLLNPVRHSVTPPTATAVFVSPEC